MRTRRELRAADSPGLSKLRSAVRLGRGTLIVAACLLLGTSSLLAATARTTNFEVSAETEAVACFVARHAEELRSTLALDWLGHELATWTQPCLISVDTSQVRLTGDTSYTILADRVTRWRMVLNGPIERIVETLLPHEMLHTILASHFQKAVPRWADEGAALSVEAEGDRRRLWYQEGPGLVSGAVQPLGEMFLTESYPEDALALRRFYAQSAAVTEFLLIAGKPRFLEFVQSGMHSNWESAIADHYGFADSRALEQAWIGWLRNDRPVIALANEGEMLSAAAGRMAEEERLVGVQTQTVSNGDVALQTSVSVEPR